MIKIKIAISILLLFIISGCGKKQSEVEIKKFEDNKNTIAKDSTSNLNQNKSDLKSSGTTENLTVSSKDAKSYINKKAVVTGYVADVAIREKVSYLNFDNKFPKNTFAGVIFKKDSGTFGDLSRYKNKTIELTGIITEYNKKPQMLLTDISQIKIIK